MFTGLVEVLGTVRALNRHGGGARLEVAATWPDAEPPGRGDSIAVNGACLTAVDEKDEKWRWTEWAEHKCQECGGNMICQQNREEPMCRECGSSSICQHGRPEHECKECGGSSIC